MQSTFYEKNLKIFILLNKNSSIYKKNSLRPILTDNQLKISNVEIETFEPIFNFWNRKRDRNFSSKVSFSWHPCFQLKCFLSGKFFHQKNVLFCFKFIRLANCRHRHHSPSFSARQLWQQFATGCTVCRPLPRGRCRAFSSSMVIMRQGTTIEIMPKQSLPAANR